MRADQVPGLRLTARTDGTNALPPPIRADVAHVMFPPLRHTCSAAREDASPLRRRVLLAIARAVRTPASTSPGVTQIPQISRMQAGNQHEVPKGALCSTQMCLTILSNCTYNTIAGSVLLVLLALDGVRFSSVRLGPRTSTSLTSFRGASVHVRPAGRLHDWHPSGQRRTPSGARRQA